MKELKYKKFILAKDLVKWFNSHEYVVDVISIVYAVGYGYVLFYTINK